MAAGTSIKKTAFKAISSWLVIATAILQRAVFPLQELPQDIAKELAAMAKAIASPGKGILAADESTGATPAHVERKHKSNLEA